MNVAPGMSQRICRCGHRKGEHELLICMVKSCHCDRFDTEPAPGPARNDPRPFRVEAEWWVEEGQEAAERLAESLMLLGAETTGSTPGWDACGFACSEQHTYEWGRCAAAVQPAPKVDQPTRHVPTDGRLDYCVCGQSWPCAWTVQPLSEENPTDV